MLSDFVEPYILFLKGVSLDDIVTIEDMFNQEILDASDTTMPDNAEESVWDRVSTEFVSLDKWSKSTNIRCWFCTLKFKSMPWFIINNISLTADGKVYNIKGNFCSCGCLMGFVKRNYSNRENFDIYHNVYSLYKIFTGRQKISILPSPDIYNLLIYGGTMSMEAYKEELEKINEKNMSSD